MPVTGQTIRDALAAVGAVGKQIRPFDELAAGADAALRQAPAGLTGAGAASFLADKAQESAYFRATAEYGTKLRYDPFRGRTFQMVTWEGNYRLFGQWCKARGLVADAETFVKNPTSLADYRWAWLGGVWYFQANDLWPWANAGDHLRVSQAVNGGRGRAGTSFTPNHWDARRKMFEAFRRAGDTLLPAGAAPAPPPTVPSAGSGPDSIPTMAEGTVGAHVHRLAAWLVRNYPAYAAIPLDPNPARQRYGPTTVAALREFQRRSGVTGPDAVGTPVGPRTKTALWAAGYRP